MDAKVVGARAGDHSVTATDAVLLEQLGKCLAWVNIGQLGIDAMGDMRTCLLDVGCARNGVAEQGGPVVVASSRHIVADRRVSCLRGRRAVCSTAMYCLWCRRVRTSMVQRIAISDVGKQAPNMLHNSLNHISKLYTSYYSIIAIGLWPPRLHTTDCIAVAPTTMLRRLQQQYTLLVNGRHSRLAPLRALDGRLLQSSTIPRLAARAPSRHITRTQLQALAVSAPPQEAASRPQHAAPYTLINFYHLVDLPQPFRMLRLHREFCEGRDLSGRIYISKQGINAQYSGATEDALAYVQCVHLVCQARSSTCTN